MMKSEFPKFKVPIQAPDLLLPKKGTDMQAWATVACDQYTSEPAYWDRVAQKTAGKPSAYQLMLPELYLDEPDVDARIEKINRTMETYLTDGTFDCLPQTMMLVKRKTKYAPVRTGLMMAFDLEAYDYRKGSGSLIRATEGTVTERIPPRMKIRKNAALEMPHILILIDDPEHTVIEPLAKALSDRRTPPAYDFDLMEEGGHIEGIPVSDPVLLQQVTDALEKLADPNRFCARYHAEPGTPVLLFAVGDGNHSLASAKCHYEQNPNPKSRYALAELVNVHDAGIVFEPIHRVLFDADEKELLDAFRAFFGENADCADGEPAHTIPYLCGEKAGALRVRQTVHTLAVGALQTFLDDFLAKHPGSRVDYIHGEETVRQLARKSGNIGFILPAMDKNDLYTTVIRNGALPRKTFSMGEACEKRFYLECREIR